MFEYNQEIFAEGRYDTYLFAYASIKFQTQTPHKAINYINSKRKEDMEIAQIPPISILPVNVLAPRILPRDNIDRCTSLTCNNYAYFYKLIKPVKSSLDLLSCWRARIGVDYYQLPQHGGTVRVVVPQGRQQITVYKTNDGIRHMGKILRWMIVNAHDLYKVNAQIQQLSNGNVRWIEALPTLIEEINGARYCGFFPSHKTIENQLKKQILVYREMQENKAYEELKMSMGVTELRRTRLRTIFDETISTNRDRFANYWNDLKNIFIVSKNGIKVASITTPTLLKSLQVDLNKINQWSDLKVNNQYATHIAKRPSTFGGLRKKTKRRRKKKKKSRRKNKRKKKTKRRRKKKKKTRRRR